MALVRMRVMTPSTVLGARYELAERLGEGAAGVVWRAWDRRLERSVAVKQLPVPPGLAGEDVRRAHDDAAREGRIAARLQHPAVAAMLDMVVDERASWLVMEYVRGRSLAAAVDRGRLTPQETARIGAELADALAVAHAAGVVHCDVKPANVLLGPAGEVKLADFGIARAVRGETLTGPGVLSGTPLFMAPEVARGHWPDAAADVYSLAATLYAAVEGTGPFGPMDHDGPLAMIRRVAECTPRPPRRAGPLTGVLTALLVADPGARPSAATARDLLREVVAPNTAPIAVSPSRAPVVTLPVGGDRPARPRRARAVTALSAVGVVGLGAVAGGIGGNGMMSLLSSVAPAPFADDVSTGDAPAPGWAGAPTVGTTGTAPDVSAAPVRPTMPVAGPPIVVPDRSSSVSTVSDDDSDDDRATTPRRSSSSSSSSAASSRTTSSLPVEAGVIEDVPVAGPVLGGTLSGVTSTVDDVLPVDLGGDGPVGLPVDLDDLPVDLGELPVDLGELPVDLGGDGPVGLPVDLDELPVDLGGEGPVGLPVDLPILDGSGSGSGSGLELPLLGGGEDRDQSDDESDDESDGGGTVGRVLDVPAGLLGGADRERSSSERSSGAADADDEEQGSSRASGSPLSVLSFPTGSGDSSSQASDDDGGDEEGDDGDATSGGTARGLSSTLGSVVGAGS